MRASAVVGRTPSSISKGSWILTTVLLLVSASSSLSATITATPATLGFGNVATGNTSAKKTVTVKNTGTSAQPVVIVATQYFTESDTCAGSVAAGKTCTMTVTFAPTVLGAQSGSVTVSDTSNNVLASVTVTGTGVVPTTLSATSMTFGSQAVGTTSAAKTATFKNAQTVALTISSIAISGGTAPEDYTWGGTCPITPNTLAAGATCSITVTFTPSASGSRTGTLTVTHSATTSPQSISLAGTGTLPVTVTPTSETFGTVVAGNTSGVKLVTLTNNQKTTALTFTNIATSANFAIASNTCGSSIAAGAKCEVGVTFSPTVTGLATGTLTFTDSAAGSPQTVTLSGTGSVTISLSPTSETFATQAVGTTSAAKTVTLTNHLASSLSVSSVTASGDFAVSSNACSPSVGAGLKCTIGVTFKPTQSGTRTGTLTINYGGPGSPALVNLTGTGKGGTTYTIGGTISGLTGSGLVLQNNGGNNLLVASGATSFTFSTAVAAGSTYSVTVLTQPSSPTEACTVTNGSGTANANVTNVQVSCSTTTYTIGGTISGLTGSGLVLQNNGGNNLTVASGATSFTFSSAVAAGSTYNVTVLTQPSSPTESCTVTNGSGTANANVTNVQVSCSTTTYTIGGTISGLTGSGLVLQNNGGNNLSVASGATSFTFSSPVNAGSTYNVTVLTQPSSPTETCTVTNGSGTANANVTNVQISCSTTTYTIGGTISGLTGTGLVLQDNGGNNLSVASGATSFTFSAPVAAGSKYSVTVLTEPSSPTQTCTVTNGSGTANANVTNVQVSCTTTTYTIGGTISGLTGSGLVLQNNGGNNLTVASGATSFTFSNPVNAGSAYNVTVLTQPSSPTETCSVTNGSGTANGNVTNVQVACTTSTLSATLNPSSAHQGSATTVVITGSATAFGPTTTVNFGADITAGAVSVNGPTSLSVPIVLANVAATGSRSVTITTGGQVVTATFTVVAGVPVMTAISPNMIQPTQTESVAITGAFTSWVNGTTQANFGPGIAVGGAAAGAFGPVTVNNATSLSASLVTSGATTGFRNVQIQTGGQTLTVNNGIYVQTCNGTAPTVVSISPNSGATSVPLNSVVQVQFSIPMNASTLSLGNSGSATVFFYDTVTNQEIPGAIALDASSTIATITPSETLAAGRTFSIYLSHTNPLKDVCGDSLAGQQFYFTTAFGNDFTGPALTGTSPKNGDTNVPLNAPVVLQFNDQLDPITAQTGFSMQSGGTVVAGTFSYSANDQTVTFTPISALAASTTYTVSYSSQVSDTVGNSLTNPGSFIFTTGTISNTFGPAVLLSDPANQSTNVGLNVTPHVTFTEPVNQLTIPGAFSLTYENAGPAIAATVTIATNRMSATIKPSAQLLPNTQYGLSLCGFTDLAGNAGTCFNSTFVTGASAITSGATVSTIAPSNGTTSVPTNAQVVAVMSNQIDPTSVNNSSITVTPGGGSPIAGSVSLAQDGVTLTFVPSASLTASVVYTVSVSGFTDVQGNGVTPFTSTFTTTSLTYGSSSFKLTSFSPTNKATGVSVTSPVTFTLTNLVDAASVSNQTVQVELCFDGANCTITESLAGTYAVSGTTVTFTPLSPYPASTIIGMNVVGLLDVAGDIVTPKFGSFTTASTVDSTPPTVSITPLNGAINVGLNSQIVLTFSESINGSTLTPSSLGIFNGDVPVNYTYTISQDNRTVVVTPGGTSWTPNATINIGLSNAIQDLSGNQLANTTSQFTLASAVSGTAPSVVAMRPGNGATNVPANSPVTLFTSAAMNASTISGALEVTDNGVVVSGTMQVYSNGQAIEFTPSNSFNPGDVIQVFLNSSAQSASGVALTSYSAQFTIAGAPANTAAVVQAVNPFPGATNVPLNTVLQLQFNQSLALGSISCNGSSGSVTLYQSSSASYLTPTCTLIGNGQIINIAPTSNLISGSQYQVSVTTAVTNTSSVPVKSFSASFTAGTAADTAAPTITSEAPTNNATNIGTNSLVSVSFNKAINPVSVSGSTIQLSGNSITEVPSSISFTPNYTRVTIVPQAPLPASTLMTLAVNGVTSQAGKSVATTTTTFTTAAQPDFTMPYVISSSVQSGQRNVPVNSVFSMKFSKPMDIGSFNAANVYVSGGIAAQIVPSTASWSADQTTIFLVPNTTLNVGDGYSLCSASMTDLDGNVQQSFCASFTAAFVSNPNAPTVVNTSPENTLTQVPTNSPVEILFSEPVQPTTIGQITLSTGGNQVAFSSTFSDANQLLTLIPAQPLLPNAGYSLAITGVKDTAGNQMTGTVTNTFTTGPSFDLNQPTVVLIDPAANTINVGTNVAPRVVFSERLNPLSVVTSSNETYNQGSVELLNTATNQLVPVTVSMSSDRTTATLTPTSALSPNTQYQLYIGQTANYYDVAGNGGAAYTGNFTTGSGTITAQTKVSTIAPANNQTGVPLNAQIVAVMSDSIDPTTITNSSITVTPSGGSAIAGTVTLASDGVTLTFAPSAALTTKVVYSISVGGFNDVQGNAVATYNSSFTAGTATYIASTFTLSTTNPASQASGVSVTSPVTFTMTHLIDSASVNASTVEVCVNICSPSFYLSGTYSVSGATVTFTPLTPYPGGATIAMYVDGLMDEAGNVTNNQDGGSFTTASTTDSTAPTVAVTPSNNSSNLGLNTQVVLTFSKSVNPNTITANSANLFNGDVALNPAMSISQDNRTVVLNSTGNALPAGATITVVATHAITDFSGNVLADTKTQFTTTSAPLTSAPTVVNSRPANGATNVPANSPITLFTSAPMNTSTINGALYVSQNGVLVSGTTTSTSSGQTIQFTPGSSFEAGTPIQVFLSSTAQDIYGNNLSNFAETFTVAGAPANTAASVQTVNPFPNATNVPLNTVIQLAFNQALQTGTVTCTGSTGSVTLYQGSTSTYLTPTCSVTGSGQIINIAPTGGLLAGSTYTVTVNNTVTNADGIAVQPLTFSFTAGAAADNAAPTVVSLAPSNSATNVGTNAGVSVNFNKAINPVSVTGSTIQVSGGGVTAVPSSISFSPGFTRTTIVPQAPLPASTQMAVTISGVTSEAGTAVAAQTTHFTTAAGPIVAAPYVVNASVASNQYVGTNAAFAMQFSTVMDPGSVNPGGAQDVYVYDSTATAYVATTVSFSTDSTTVFLKPTSNLAANHQFQMCANAMMDISGNSQQNFCVTFYSGSGTDTTGPSVLQVSPPSGFTGIATNSPIAVLFNEPVDAASISGVQLKQGGSVISTNAGLFDGNQGVQLLPLTLLAPNTTYTIVVAGVLDITGNAQVSLPSQSFTTGTGVDLIQPSVVSTTPANGATGVAAAATVQAVFSLAVDPASFDPTNSFVLRDSSHNQVPATISFSSDYKTVTLTPKSSLTSGGAAYTLFISYFSPVYDVSGNQIPPVFVFFTTQ